MANRISNPDFEINNLNGWGTYGTSSITNSTNYAKSGTRSMRVVATDPFAGVFFEVTATAPVGELNQFKCWVCGDATSAGKFVYALIKCEADGTIQFSVPVKLQNGVFVEILIHYRIPTTGAVTVQVQGRNLASGEIYYVDDVYNDLYVLPSFTTYGRHIRKDGNRITFRGYNHNNQPIGTDNGYDWSNQQDQFRFDMEQMKANGADALRVYIDTYNRNNYNACLDEAFRNGIQVIVLMFIPWDVDYSVATGAANRTAQTTRITDTANALRYHPAVVAVGMGSENNYHLTSPAVTKTDWYSLVDSLCVTFKGIATTKLTTIWTGETIDIDAHNAGVPNLDFWGVTLYRGRTYTTLADDLRTSTSKPLVIGETGFDSWDGTAEDEPGQSARNLDLVKNQDKYFNYISGAFIFSFADEWMKMGTPLVQNTNGIANSHDDRDGTLTEEKLGSTLAQADGSSSFRTAKIALGTVGDYWKGNPKGKRNQIICF